MPNRPPYDPNADLGAPDAAKRNEALIEVWVNGVLVATQPRLNLTGSGVTGVDDPANRAVEVQFSGGGPGGLSDGDYGDITLSSSATVWTIDNNVVTYAKMQDISVTQRLLGRDTAGAGDAEELSISIVLDWIDDQQGSVLYRGASGWTFLAAGSAGEVLTTNGAGADPTWEPAAAGGSGAASDQLATMGWIRSSRRP